MLGKTCSPVQDGRDGCVHQSNVFPRAVVIRRRRVATRRQFSGSNAEAAGLVGLDSRGVISDVIVAVPGKPVGNLGHLALQLENVGIGNVARLTIIRAGRRHEIDVMVQNIKN